MRGPLNRAPLTNHIDFSAGKGGKGQRVWTTNTPRRRNVKPGLLKSWGVGGPERGSASSSFLRKVAREHATGGRDKGDKCVAKGTKECKRGAGKEGVAKGGRDKRDKHRICMYIYIYIYTYVYTHLSLSIYIYIYTHIYNDIYTQIGTRFGEKQTGGRGPCSPCPWPRTSRSGTRSIMITMITIITILMIIMMI